MERLKQKVASSRVFASLQQVAQAQGADEQAQQVQQQQQQQQQTPQAQAHSQAGGEQQASSQPPPLAPQVVPEAAMSPAWLMAADATAHLTDEERGILLEVFKKEEQFQRDTIKQLTASRAQLEQQQQQQAARELERRRSSRRLLGKYRAASNQSLAASPSCTPTSSSTSATTHPNSRCSCSHATGAAGASSSTPSSSLSCSLHATPTPSELPQARPGSRQSRAGAAAAAHAHASAANCVESPAPPQAQNIGQCRICRKTIGSSEPCHLCSNCQQFICDDCASYSATDQHWMCSSCRRRAMNPAIPAEALKELGLNQNSSAVRRMTLRLSQNELKLALDRKNSAAAMVAGQQKQQQQQQQAAESAASSPAGRFPQRANSMQGASGRGSASAATPTRAGGPQSQRSLERLAQENKAAGRISSSPASRQPQQQSQQQQQGAKPARAAQQSQSAGGRMAGGQPAASASGRRSFNAAGSQSSGAPPASGASGGAVASSRRSYCEQRAAKLGAQKTLSQPTAGVASSTQAYATGSPARAGGQQAARQPQRPAQAQHALQQQQQQQQSQQPQQQQQQWAGPEVKRAAPARDYASEVLEQRRASTFAAARQASLTYGAPVGEQQHQAAAAAPPFRSQYEGPPSPPPPPSYDYGEPQWPQQAGQQQPPPPPPQQAGAPLPYEMSNFVSSSPLGSRRNSRQQLNMAGQQQQQQQQQMEMQMQHQMQMQAQQPQYYQSSSGAAGGQQRLAPGELVHMRRLSDQSNLFRRASIVDDTLEGLQMARNRSHSNIDTVHQVSSYLHQAHKRPSIDFTSGGGGGSGARLHAAPRPQQQQQAQQQMLFDSQLAYQQRQSDQQLHSTCLAQEADSSSHFRRQQQQQPMGLLPLGREHERAVSTSNVLYLPHAQAGQLASHQRRLSDSGQYPTGAGSGAFAQQQQQQQQQQISSIITTYAQKRPSIGGGGGPLDMAAAAAAAAQEQQRRHRRRRQSSEDLDQADDSSSCSSLDELHAGGAYNGQQAAITIPSVSVSEFKQAARRQSIQMQQQQQQQQMREQQEQLLFAQDNQITPMQINVAIEQVIQQQQLRDQQLLLAGGELDRQQLLLLSARRGSSGRVLPRIPGDPQQSRSLLDLPLGDGGGVGGVGGLGGQLAAHADPTSGSQSNPTRASQNGTRAHAGQLDLPLLSPGIRRASAPEGQNIKIVVDDIEPLHHQPLHHSQQQHQQHHHPGAPGGHYNLRQAHSGGLVGVGGGLAHAAGAYHHAAGHHHQAGSMTKHYYPNDYYERHILCRDDSLDPNGLHVGRGFGLQVMGGKLNAAANKLEALITWVLPGAPADKVGLREGDKIVEWDGKCLVGMSYEQVAEVIESSANVAELLVKPSGAGAAASAPGAPPTHFLRSGRRMSQQTERDLRRANGEATLATLAAIAAAANQRAASEQQTPAGRAGTGRKLPQIPGGNKLAATNSSDNSYQALEPTSYFANNVRHASAGQLDHAIAAFPLAPAAAPLGPASGGGAGSRLLNNSASSQLGGAAPGAFLSAFTSHQHQAAQQQSRSASELHRGSFSGPSGSLYTQQQQPLPQHQTHAYALAPAPDGVWPAQQLQQYGGSQQTMAALAAGAYGQHHHHHQPQVAHFGSQMGALSPISGHSADELSGLIGLQVSVDERSATLEISILAAHNIERNPSLDYQVRVKILPESSRFKVCTTQPSSDMNWKETFLFHNFPIQNVHRMALEIGIWVHDEAPRLSAQMAQPICEALIPIQSARERNIDFWPLRPPPTSPQARRKSLNDLMGNHYAQQQQQLQQQQQQLQAQLQQRQPWPQQQQQQPSGRRDSGAALLSAGYKQTGLAGHPAPWLANESTSGGAGTTTQQTPTKQQAQPQQQQRPPQYRQRTSPMGSSTRVYPPNDSPTLEPHQQRERSASNRNLPDQSNKLHVQPRRASDEAATSSAGRLSARISPAASRRSISVMNVGGDGAAHANAFNPASAMVGAGRASSSRLGSQASILKAAQMRRDSASQQQQQQQYHATNSSPVAKFSAGCSPAASGSGSRASETDRQQVGCTPTGRRSSLVGIQSMAGYRSQKNSQSDATDHESPLGLSKRAREQAAAAAVASQLAQQQQHQQHALPNVAQDSRQAQQQQLQTQQRRPSSTTTMVAGQQQPPQQQQQQRQVSSGPTSTRPSSSSTSNSRRGSSDQQQQQQQQSQSGLQRRGSFMQTLRKLKRTMSFNKNDNSLSGSNQDSRRSSDASNQSSSEQGEDLAVTRPIKSSDTVVGRLKLGFIMTKGQFEVDVICATGLKLENQESALGIYVKMYLRGKSKSNKRKTRIVQQPLDAPVFRQTIKYDGSLVDNKLLEVSVWIKQGTLRGKLPVGITEIRIGDMNLVQQQTSWYNLRSMDTLCSSSVEE